jgi:large subunit ribosomal protein L13
MKTYTPTKGTVNRQWYIVDATGKTLGRLASDIAVVLRGKHKPQFTPNIDVGDFVIVVNAEKIAVTGNKMRDKMYYRHSNYPGGLKSETLEQLLRRRPERVVELAVKGMLPDTKLGDAVFHKLKVYAGPRHPHSAQQPVPLERALIGKPGTFIQPTTSNARELTPDGSLGENVQP